MKITNLMTMRGAMRAQGLIIFSCLAAALVAAPAGATELTYDVENNPGWFADNAWGENPPIFDTTWPVSSEAISAVFPELLGTTVRLTESTSVTNLTLHQGITLESLSTVNLSINGGDLTVINPSFGTTIGAGVTIQGDFTFNGSSATAELLVGNAPTRWTTYAGTGTIQSGVLHHFRPDVSIGEDSNFVVAGGTLHMGRTGTTMGSLAVNSGTFLMGRRPTSGSTFTFTVASLSGTGGTIKSTGSSGVITFVVDQSATSSYAGSILGAEANIRTELEKAGTGDLTLTGQVDLRRTTTVSGGRLYINSEHTAFSDEAGATAISVDGGTLGGTGTITVTDDADVVVGADGKLAAGIEGQAGRTTVALDGGTLNLSDATASANTGWLKFDLGSHDTAGTTYDQIQITGGALNIGDGLNFNDFDFVLQDGFRGGKFVLFETSAPIVGTLGTTMGTGEDFSGAEILIEGNNLVLTFPPPGTLLMIR